MSDWLAWMDLSQNITPPRAPCGANNLFPPKKGIDSKNRFPPPLHAIPHYKFFMKPNDEGKWYLCSPTLYKKDSGIKFINR